MNERKNGYHRPEVDLIDKSWNAYWHAKYGQGQPEPIPFQAEQPGSDEMERRKQEWFDSWQDEFGPLDPDSEADEPALRDLAGAMLAGMRPEALRLGLILVIGIAALVCVIVGTGLYGIALGPVLIAVGFGLLLGLLVALYRTLPHD